MLLLRGYGCLPLNHLHLHGAWHEQLRSVLATCVWLWLVAAHLLLLLLELLLLLLLLVVLLVVGTWPCGGRMLDLLLVLLLLLLLLLLVVSDACGGRGDYLPAARLVASGNA